ncbi:hypothetical protein ACLB1N_22570 [Escherichia coli]
MMALSVTGACRCRGSTTDDTANAQQAEWRSWEVNKRLNLAGQRRSSVLSAGYRRSPPAARRTRMKAR